MSNILVLFDVLTSHVAGSIASSLRLHGHTTSLVSADSTLPKASGFDAVVVGSRMLFGFDARVITDYVAANRADFEAMPTAFFSVSPDGKPRRDDTLRKLGWTPLETAAFTLYAEPARISEFAERFHQDVEALAER